MNRARFPLLTAVAIATAATAHAAPRVALGLTDQHGPAVDTTIFLSAHGETTLRLHPVPMSVPPQKAPMAKPQDVVDAPTHRVTISQIDADAIGRVAYAEAGNQGPAGLMAVIDTILNRARSGEFPRSIRALLDAPNQFQTVTDAGGSWRNLPPLTLMQQVQYRTILDLIKAGGMRDISKGALYFQNPALEASEARNGDVSADEVGFDGAKPVVTIGAQTFYHTIPSIPATARAQRQHHLFVAKAGREHNPNTLFVPVNARMNIQTKPVSPKGSPLTPLEAASDKEPSSLGKGPSANDAPLIAAKDLDRAASTSRKRLTSSGSSPTESPVASPSPPISSLPSPFVFNAVKSVSTSGTP